MVVYFYFLRNLHTIFQVFPGDSLVRNLPANVGNLGPTSGWRRFSGGGNGNQLQNFCLGNPMDRGGWQSTVYGVAKELDTTERLSTHACILFSIVAVPIYVSTNSVRGSLFSILSLAFLVCRHFDNGHSDQCEVILHFVLISLILSDVKHVFMSLYFFYMSFLEEYLFRSSVHFLLGCLFDIELFEYFGN